MIISEKNSKYHLVTIPKTKGIRILNCIEPNSKLYDLQKNILNNFLESIPLVDNVFGFIKDVSYKDFLIPHKSNNQKKYYVRVDIKSFFDSINSNLIKNALIYHFRLKKDNENEEELRKITEIFTLNDCLPQGAVTSPAISNIVFRPLDIKIRNYCRKLDFTYTRYADDLLFSSYNIKIFKPFFVKMITKILKEYGFFLNFKKLKKTSKEISLNGFVVGENIRLSRKRKNDIAAILFSYEDGKKPNSLRECIGRFNEIELYYRNKPFLVKSDIINYLNGYRSFILSWLIKEYDSDIYLKNKRLIERIEKIVQQIEKLN
ncbi:reverse transcriptase family protein [Paenibacillus sp. KACC 21273]|uniref:reverse transcriptase family protein n=1 Tax=Paenibacillus sp. KACC 21273 TaxID=3025665 RepID=UPI0023650C79|nr:reverse transcriptase family protein [Paenibacillus sp. KACC 21273]WDF51898.1 reverse transcriptase family protein [Paenibacillus sp. KACC 21273]